MTIKIESVDNIREAAKIFVENIGDKKLFSFEGKMGAGKTTFIKAICEELGVIDNVNSPTFSIVNEYNTSAGEIIFHFDFYRIQDEREALEIGIPEYLESGELCFMEWSENIASLLPDYLTRVFIEEEIDGTRFIEVRE